MKHTVNVWEGCGFHQLIVWSPTCTCGWVGPISLDRTYAVKIGYDHILSEWWVDSIHNRTVTVHSNLSVIDLSDAYPL